ncbi:SCF ubiquitin ligase complex subunit cdc4 [Pleurotus pulmonarius]|nr:SCF ubiquitin ligase complex subunit cdc4 [Pleurotus pulmonarius]KAF4579229.1 SCF ubiquitin ligase complex subunit cdc4 [Pleurotus pulmonarius]
MSPNQRPQLVLGPSVSTTRCPVVTTTTTTTTYAPITLPPLPPPSSPKDPKNYPLLHTTLPRSLRRFPLVFPGGAHATFRDAAEGDEEMQEEEETVGGSGWRMLRHDEDLENVKTVNLTEAVERYGKKRSHGSDNMMEGVETTSEFERGNPAPPRKKARASGLPPISTVNAAAPPSPLPSPHGSPTPENIWPSAPPSGASSPLPQAPLQPDLSLTTLLTLPSLLAHFTNLPPALQSHLLLTLLRHSPLPVLRTLHSVLTPTLARDFLTLLPPELVSQILSHLPFSTLARASLTGELLRSLKGHEGGVWALAANKDILVSGSTDRTVRIWDLSTGRCSHVFSGHTSTVRCLAIVKPEIVDVELEGRIMVQQKWPKRPLIVTGSRDHSLRVWTLPRPDEPEYQGFGVEDAEADPGEDADENPYHRLHLQGHTLAVRALAARGRTLVSGSYDCTVRIWDIITGTCKWVLEGHTQKVYSVVLDPSRNQACSGSMDGTVRIWNLDNGNCQHTLIGHTSLVGLLGLSPSYLVSAAADSTLRIWDPDSGELRHTLAAHTGAITCFQHDEFKVLSGSDGTLKMWDIRDGTVVRDLLTGITGVWQVVFEGRWCVAASNRSDSTVLDVWDFGDDEDKDWIGEPPGGIYDEDWLSEDDDDELGPHFVKEFLDDPEVTDTEAMDQDMIASELDSSNIDSQSARNQERNTPERSDMDEDLPMVPMASSSAAGVDMPSWAANSQNTPHRLSQSSHSAAGGPNPLRPFRRLGGPNDAQGPPELPDNNETPTRPRVRTYGVRRR